MTIPHRLDSFDVEDAFDLLTAAIARARVHWNTLSDEGDDREFTAALKLLYGQTTALTRNLQTAVEDHPVLLTGPSWEDEHALRQDELV